MPTSNKSILRNDKVTDVEDFPLPNWDKNGNEIPKPVKPQANKSKPTQVEDVAEEQVKVPTLKEVEAIREDAYNEGFEQGYQNGLAQGMREGETQGKKQGYDVGYQEGITQGVTTGHEQAVAEERVKTDSKLTVLASFANELKNQMSQEQSEIEKALLALSVRIARQVLQDEIHLDPKHIAVIVHAAVQSLPNPDEKLTVFVNPSELDFVASFADSHWSLEADATIKPGGCKIKSKYSYVDYTLEHRFDTAVSQLISHLDDIDVAAVKKPISDQYLMPIAEPSIKPEPSPEQSPDQSPDENELATTELETDKPGSEQTAETQDQTEVASSETSDDAQSEAFASEVVSNVEAEFEENVEASVELAEPTVESRTDQEPISLETIETNQPSQPNEMEPNSSPAQAEAVVTETEPLMEPKPAEPEEGSVAKPGNLPGNVDSTAEVNDIPVSISADETPPIDAQEENNDPATNEEDHGPNSAG